MYAKWPALAEVCAVQTLLIYFILLAKPMNMVHFRLEYHKSNCFVCAVKIRIYNEQSAET